MSHTHISDGMTVTKTFTAPKSFNYPDVEMTFRPAGGREFSALQQRADALRKQEKFEEAELAIDSFLAARLSYWSLKASDGQDLPINPDTVGSLHVRLRNDLYDAMCGFEQREKN